MSETKRLTVEEVNAKIIEKYGENVKIKIEPYTEDDGTEKYRYWHHDSYEMTWEGFETVEEAYENLCLYLSFEY